MPDAGREERHHPWCHDKGTDPGGPQEVRFAIFEATEAIDRPTMERRLEHPAANAWQEREWVKADLVAVSGARGFDLDVKDQRQQAAEVVDRLYATAARVLNHVLGMEHAREAVHSRDSDRLVRTLETLAGCIASTAG